MTNRIKLQGFKADTKYTFDRPYVCLGVATHHAQAIANREFTTIAIHWVKKGDADLFKIAYAEKGDKSYCWIAPQLN